MIEEGAPIYDSAQVTSRFSFLFEKEVKNWALHGDLDSLQVDRHIVGRQNHKSKQTLAFYIWQYGRAVVLKVQEHKVKI